MSQVYKILIIAPAWVGDMVMSQTLLKVLMAQYSGRCQIDVLVNEWARDVVKRMPEVSQVHCNPFGHGQLQLAARWRLGRQLAREHYDQAIVLPNSWKSALIPFFAGIKRRTGFIGELRYGLLNDYYRLHKLELPLMIDRFAALANHGHKLTTLPWPALQVATECQQPLCTRLGLSLTQPIIVLCPAAEYGPAKRWPASHFAALSDQLQAKGYQVWILGAAKDYELGQQIVVSAQQHAHLVNLCGATTLVEVIDLIGLATAVVTNDSGLMHVAAAVGIPLVAIYGSSSPGFTPPLSACARIVKLDLACAPCFARTCQFGHYNCLRQLTPARVMDALAEVIRVV